MSVTTVDTRSQPRGFWGMAFLVGSEATLLACLFGTYWYLRFKSHDWPPPGIPEPKVLWPVVLTLVLLSTSVPMQLALHAAKRRRVRVTQLLLLGSLLVQVGYLAVQVHLFRADLHAFTPQEHAYASIYYLLLGADHFHVLVGILLNAFLLAKLVGGLTQYRIGGVQASAVYWHFVNVFTVLVLLTQISPRL
jgi:heme/copper-type cytochrome/quinol oxidase subunit 3